MSKVMLRESGKCRGLRALIPPTNQLLGNIAKISFPF